MKLLDRLLRRDLEERADDSYTDAVVAALLDRAQSSDIPTGYTSSEEHASGLWARALASARFSPVTRVTEALTPEVLASMGRLSDSEWRMSP